jgi:predicted small metal-binding protein
MGDRTHMPGSPKLTVHLTKEDKMQRKFIDCRTVRSSDSNCTVAISADTETELLEAAVQHAIAVHGHNDSPELRDMIRGAMKDGTPPIDAPQRAA